MNNENLLLLFTALRKRLIIVTVTVVSAAIVCFAFGEQVRYILLLPGAGLDEGGLDLQLIFLTPSEALVANLRLAFIAGATVTFPIILYQFVAIALAAVNRKSSPVWLTFIMYILFVLGVSFAYFVVLPFALNFFVSFSGPDLIPTFSIARYISFTSSFLFSFGLVFQLPVLFWFLGAIGLVDTPFLRRNRKFALLIIMVFSSILTPPDIFSQVLMAIPLMILYELGILMVHLAWRKKRKMSAANEDLTVQESQDQ